MEKIRHNEILDKIRGELSKAIVEQEKVVELVITALLCNGHVLLEGVPGLAKTLTIKALGKTMGLNFKRIQFTPDLMPSDVTGTNIYNVSKKEFEMVKGPVFTNLLLGDEINRTPPKTQSGLLEAMEEGAVTIEGKTEILQKPFIVFATQNPIEYEGTYPLPEALLDRFLFKIKVDYLSENGEVEILKRYHKGFKSVDLDKAGIEEICTREEVLELQKSVESIKVEESLFEYIVKIVKATRESGYIEMGSSPRGAIALLQASKAYALIQNRDYVIPEDIKYVAYPVLRHRIIVKAEYEMEGMTSEAVIENILSSVKVPR
ncbi:AAA family ATPase [Oceanirhabdus sp. W0125-5]|uniref:AAA family ATPase n=1 Tax=Oceanirhabdus sp. W0125-5 TaxID=2999116 RepID=UPI0022F3152A|nr:MoxR family ATPase [Oceanirhabdus sp. W0125-5]WBW95975.1 MoxR family ATPase [Oceanirhabdus sp. W0125-5]